jgi:hypothetical protein
VDWAYFEPSAGEIQMVMASILPETTMADTIERVAWRTNLLEMRQIGDQETESCRWAADTKELVA